MEVSSQEETQNKICRFHVYKVASLKVPLALILKTYVETKGNLLRKNVLVNKFLWSKKLRNHKEYFLKALNAPVKILC